MTRALKLCIVTPISALVPFASRGESISEVYRALRHPRLTFGFL